MFPLHVFIISFSNFYNKFFTHCLFAYGSLLLKRVDSLSIINILCYLLNFWNSKISLFPIFIPANLSIISLCELGLNFIANSIICKRQNKNKNFIYFVGTDNILNNDYSTVYQGFFENAISTSCNLVSPSTTYVESNYTYLNLEGRFRFTSKILTVVRSIYSDYSISTQCILS